MSLSIKRLEFHNFRNYEHFLLEDIEPMTVFVGENAVGKTNIIEGLQLLTSLCSFRHPRMEHMRREGASTCEISQRVVDDTRLLDVMMRIIDNRRTYYLNGKAKKTADLKGILPSVIFTPDDLELVKDSHGIRREELDAFGSQLSPNHYVIKKDYESVLKHKNRLLKDEADDILIENINDMLITCGAQLSCYRAALVRKMAPYLQSVYQELSSGKEHIELQYVPLWFESELAKDRASTFTRDDARRCMREAMEVHRVHERESRRSLVGPHLDHLIFTLDGKDASLFGSQGQQRSIVLALKLAELMVIQDMLHQKPVLLLDDVMSELDARRRAQLVSFIAGDIQVFITTTTMDYFKDGPLSAINEIHLPLGQRS